MNKNELDKKRVLELLERDSQFLDVNIWEIDEELRDDPEIVLAFARKTRDASVIQYTGNNLRNDKEFLLEIARCDKDGYNMGLAMVVSRAGEEVKEDKEFFIELLKKEGSLYRYMGDKLKEDSDLKLISAISNIGNKFYDGSEISSFEYKINEFLSRVKNGIPVRGENKNRPYSFRVELENYEHNKNFRAGIDDEIKNESVFVQESPEEIERQIALLEHIKEITSNRKKEGQTKSPLQQRETELSTLEAEARGYDEAEALKDKLEQVITIPVRSEFLNMQNLILKLFISI